MLDVGVELPLRSSEDLSRQTGSILYRLFASTAGFGCAWLRDDSVGFRCRLCGL